MNLRGPVAQSVEQLTLNQLVVGSNPSRPTKDFKAAIAAFFVMAG